MTNLQAAAERLSKANRSCIDYAALCEADTRVVCDSLALAEAYLSEHLPDDGEFIDSTWLASLGLKQELPLMFHLGVHCINCYEGQWELITRGSTWICNVETRGQLRLLARALGVELGEGR